MHYNKKHIFDEQPRKLYFVCPKCGFVQLKNIGEEEEDNDASGLIMFSFFAMMTIVACVMIISIFENENLKMCIEKTSNKDICFTK